MDDFFPLSNMPWLAHPPAILRWLAPGDYSVIKWLLPMKFRLEKSSANMAGIRQNQRIKGLDFWLGISEPCLIDRRVIQPGTPQWLAQGKVLSCSQHLHGNFVARWWRRWVVKKLRSWWFNVDFMVIKGFIGFRNRDLACRNCRNFGNWPAKLWLDRQDINWDFTTPATTVM